MVTQDLDVVDVSVSSTTADVDAILEHPLLDGSKDYSIEVTEFTCPLGSETPLPRDSVFAEVANQDRMFLLKVFRRRVGRVPGTLYTRLNDDGEVSGVGYGRFDELLIFYPSSRYPIQTINDLVLHLQNFLNNIKARYLVGLDTRDHGAVPDMGEEDPYPDGADQVDISGDSFCQVSMSLNGTIQFKASALFTEHFYMEFSPFARHLFGINSQYFSCTRTLDANQNTILQEGVVSLISANGHIKAGSAQEDYILRGDYPLTRNFEHRVGLEVDASGMPVPAVVAWTTTSKQSIRHTLSSFPIPTSYTTRVSLSPSGYTLGNYEFEQKFLGDQVVFRRAEDKISERFKLQNTQFFQNLRFGVFLERRVWDPVKEDYIFERSKILLDTGDTWTLKVRFRTLK